MSSSAKSIGLVFLSALFLIISCKQKEKIGVDPSQNIGVNYTDTFSINTKVFLDDDSINLSQLPLLYVGAYADPEFGNISAEGYVQLVRETDTVNTTGFTTVNSVELTLEYSYYYGDTLQPQTINVRRITEDISSSETYYTDSDAPLLEAGIKDNDDVINLTPSFPQSGYAVQKIDLQTTFGEDILNVIGDKNPNFTTDFKGIALLPKTPNSGAIMGIKMNNTSYVKINYTRNGTPDSVRLFLAGARFSKVTADRSASPTLSGLVNIGDEVNLSGISYSQDVTGVQTKIFIPGLDSLKKLAGKIAVNRAELVIELDDSNPNTNPEKFAPESSLFPIKLTAAGSPNKVTAPNGDIIFDYIQREYTDVNAVGYPVEAIYNSTTKSYNFLISPYVHAIINGDISNNGFLLSNTRYIGFNRSVGNVKLRLYVTSIKE